MHEADFIEVQFQAPVASNSMLLDASNYSITPVASGLPVSVLKVIDTSEPRPTSVFLVVTVPTPGEEYALEVANLTDSTGASFTGPLSITYTHRRTKTDNILSSRPKLYDLRAGSTIRALFGAIGMEDDLIGGRGDRN